MAVSEQQREAMLQGLVGLRRLRSQLPGNEDVTRAIEGIKAALGEAVPQRTAARALGISHPELSKLISAQKLAVADTSRGRGQVVVDSLVELIESAEIAPPEPPTWKQRRARREAETEDGGATGDKQADLARIMKARALAFHRALARNLDGEQVAKARETAAARRDSGQMSDQQANEWLVLLERPLSDIAAKMTDYSPAGEALRASSPFA
jgi:hypothetical protein